MNAAQAFAKPAMSLHTADGKVTGFREDSAFKGVIVAVALSLPIWAAIVASGQMVVSWF